ncbi:21173_t:CDS:2 [Cetraspora pellucida]|uniref:21173_t:CDS:1 n=1 Tax=Cetraspora pellucida TaxID=1433469 RepID=A0A9N8WHD2_9GLOM|nr:21173_t:CDS:2 [Cetraspora pellucida]
MLESDLSKGDLEELCCALGVSTDGVKADLVQRLKQLSSEVGQSSNSIEETGETSLENYDVDDQGDHVIEQSFLSNEIADPDNPFANTEECTN